MTFPITQQYQPYQQPIHTLPLPLGKQPKGDQPNPIWHDDKNLNGNHLRNPHYFGPDTEPDSGSLEPVPTDPPINVAPASPGQFAKGNITPDPVNNFLKAVVENEELGRILAQSTEPRFVGQYKEEKHGKDGFTCSRSDQEVKSLFPKGLVYEEFKKNFPDSYSEMLIAAFGGNGDKVEQEKVNLTNKFSLSPWVFFGKHEADLIYPAAFELLALGEACNKNKREDIGKILLALSHYFTNNGTKFGPKAEVKSGSYEGDGVFYKDVGFLDDNERLRYIKDLAGQVANEVKSKVGSILKNIEKMDIESEGYLKCISTLTVPPVSENARRKRAFNCGCGGA